jgi:hypothetical protein
MQGTGVCTSEIERRQALLRAAMQHKPPSALSSPLGVSLPMAVPRLCLAKGIYSKAGRGRPASGRYGYIQGRRTVQNLLHVA